MRNVSYLITLLASMFFVCSVCLWAQLAKDRRSALSQAGAMVLPNLEAAAVVSVISFGLSFIAALLAVVHWISR
jgi:hypothetical protein